MDLINWSVNACFLVQELKKALKTSAFGFLAIANLNKEKGPAKAGQSVKLGGLYWKDRLIRINVDAFACYYPSLLNTFLILEREKKH